MSEQKTFWIMSSFTPDVSINTTGVSLASKEIAEKSAAKLGKNVYEVTVTVKSRRDLRYEIRSVSFDGGVIAAYTKHGVFFRDEHGKWDANLQETRELLEDALAAFRDSLLQRTMT